MNTSFKNNTKSILCIIAISLILVAIARAHPQYTMMPQTVVNHIQQTGWWSWANKRQTLAFCVGTDINNKPVCTPVPDRYVVIEYINPPKK